MSRHKQETDYLISALATKEGPYADKLRKRLESGALQLSSAGKWIERVFATATLTVIGSVAGFLIVLVVGLGKRIIEVVWP